MDSLLNSVKAENHKGHYFEAINLMAQVIRDQDELIQNLKEQMTEMKSKMVEKR